MAQQYGQPDPGEPFDRPGPSEAPRTDLHDVRPDVDESWPGTRDAEQADGHDVGRHEAQPVPGPRMPPGRRGVDRTHARQPAVPRWLGQLPYVFVLCGVGAGLVVVAADHFRRGSVLIAASVFLGALARLVLPESQVGMLAVRRRWLDVLLMVTTAVGLTLVAFVAKGTSG